MEDKSNRVVENAKRTDALVSTLFPSSVKQRLLGNAAKKRDKKGQKRRKREWEFDKELESGYLSDDALMTPMIHTPKRRLKSFLQPGDGIDGLLNDNDSVVGDCPQGYISL